MPIKPGDIILYSVSADSEIISRIVAAGQLLLGIGSGDELYSHVAIASYTPGWQYEAKLPRSGRFPIDIARPYEVWRIGNPTDDQRMKIVRWCIENSGSLYNFTGLLTDGLIALKHTYVCSQFGQSACRAGGIMLHGNKRIFAPDDFPGQPGARRIARYEPLPDYRKRRTA